MDNNSSDRAYHAETVIRNHVVWSMGAGFIPVLVADIFAVSALQLDMIRQLCRIYDVDFAETRGKAVVTSLTGSTLARLGAGSLIKLIPGIGSMVGGATVSVFAGASTYALGEVFKSHFESGGTILDFDPARLKKFYNQKFEKGKKVAKEWNKDAKSKSKKGKVEVEDIKPAAEPSVQDIKVEEIIVEPQAATATASSTDSIVERLKQLAELKTAGIITDDEFQNMKKKVIDQL